MDWIEIVYLICFFLGLGFAIISGLLSGVFSGAEGGADAGGGDIDLDGGGAGGDIGGDGAIAFSPMSPVVLAMFVASFGGSGIIFKKVLGWNMVAHLPASAACGVLVAGAVFYVFWKMFKVTQGSSNVRSDDALGETAEVTVAIPNHGLGQIAYRLRGVRFTNSAQTLDGKEIPEGVPVKIVKRVGNTFIVEKSS